MLVSKRVCVAWVRGVFARVRTCVCVRVRACTCVYERDGYTHVCRKGGREGGREAGREAGRETMCESTYTSASDES